LRWRGRNNSDFIPLNVNLDNSTVCRFSTFLVNKVGSIETKSFFSDLRDAVLGNILPEPLN